MPRETRSTFPLPDFEFPEISQRRRMTVDTGTGATGGGSTGTVAPVETTGGTAVPTISEPMIWQETSDHGNFNPGTKIGQTIFKTKTIGPANNVQYTLTNADSHNLRRFMESRQNALGNVVTRLSVAFDSVGTATGFANIL